MVPDMGEDTVVEVVKPLVAVVLTVELVVLEAPELAELVVAGWPVVDVPGKAVADATVEIAVAPVATTEVSGRSVTSAPAALTAT